MTAANTTDRNAEKITFGRLDDLDERPVLVDGVRIGSVYEADRNDWRWALDHGRTCRGSGQHLRREAVQTMLDAREGVAAAHAELERVAS